MRLILDKNLAKNYNSMSQKVKAMTERWVNEEIYCPACGCLVDKFQNNRPVADFFCGDCKEEYELKSKKDSMGKKIADGAYATMIERLKDENNPNFFFLNYVNYKIYNFLVIPKHFFTPEIIIKRKKGIPDRPSYIMCSIDLTPIPQSGKIFYIKNGKVESKKQVLENWKKTLFLREERQIDAKGWLLDTMNCIDKIGKKEFTLDEMYFFEKELLKKHPDNHFIKDKLRQQLQILRDKNYLEFVSRGKYKLTI